MMDSFDELAASIIRIGADATHPQHVHLCAHVGSDGVCDSRCECQCGAVLEMGASFERDGRWVWRLPDGSEAPFPDPRERD